MGTSALSFKTPSSSGPATAGTTIAIDKDKLQRACSQLIKKVDVSSVCYWHKTALTQGLKGNYERRAEVMLADLLLK
ncbi:hypothetical protein D3C76_1160460 [compost metagenome]